MSSSVGYRLPHCLFDFKNFKLHVSILQRWMVCILFCCFFLSWMPPRWKFCFRVISRDVINLHIKILSLYNISFLIPKILIFGQITLYFWTEGVFGRSSMCIFMQRLPSKSWKLYCIVENRGNMTDLVDKKSALKQNSDWFTSDFDGTIVTIHLILVNFEDVSSMIATNLTKIGQNVTYPLTLLTNYLPISAAWLQQIIAKNMSVCSFESYYL